MADSEDARVDPRFDPLYQRGYAPSEDAARQVSGRRAPAPGPIHPEPPPELAEGRQSSSSSAAENSLDPVDSSSEDAIGGAPLVPSRNPYARALAIMAIAFVVIGAGAAVPVVLAIPAALLFARAIRWERMYPSISSGTGG